MEPTETLSLPLSGSLNFPDLSLGRIDEYLSMIENGGLNDTADKKVAIVDGPTSTLPSVENYEGPFGFKALPKDGPPQTFMLYSVPLGHVFIKMNNVLMMQFHLNHFPEKLDLFVRALLVYVGDGDRATAVNRCLVHYIEDDPGSQAHNDVSMCYCPNYKNAGHILRSNSSHSIYCYDAESTRHSVLHPLTRPQAGTTSISIPYTFACQSSCATGMNRRSVQIVFTLEDGEGAVLGRDVLHVKICSCPKRDKDRMEKETSGRLPGASRPNKRQAADSTSSDHVAKVKIEHSAPPPTEDRDQTKKQRLLEMLRTLKDKLNTIEEYVLREF